VPIIIQKKDWLTIDLNKPKTLPKLASESITYLREHWPGSLVYYCDNLIFDGNGLCWESNNDSADIVDGIRYVLINLDGLEWETCDINNEKTLPKEGEFYLIANWKKKLRYRFCTVNWVNVLDDDDDYMQLWWWDENEIEISMEDMDCWRVKTGDKYIHVKIEGGPCH
jgi:hypothetical protein